jgi:hypothetical protein
MDYTLTLSFVAETEKSAVKPALGTKDSLIKWGTESSFPEKWPGREVDHPPPLNSEVNNARSYTSTSPFAFMPWCLISNNNNNNEEEGRENFIMRSHHEKLLR